ncbi:MAG: hypothetical protein P1V97_04745 [Planctomycetota bacterium]|nr:hypothetical protein [Planctomycetota bacterium]
MNPAQLLNELISRQIAFTIVEDHLFLPRGQALDLAEDVQRYSRVLARLLTESFQDPQSSSPQIGRSTERFRTTLPLPSRRQALLH